MKDKKYFVYVLRSLKDTKLYTGHTSDLKRRIVEHNTGKVRSTSVRKPFRLIYWEQYNNRSEARWREKFLKSAWGKKKLKELIFKNPIPL